MSLNKDTTLSLSEQRLAEYFSDTLMNSETHSCIRQTNSATKRKREKNVSFNNKVKLSNLEDGTEDWMDLEEQIARSQTREPLWRRCYQERRAANFFRRPHIDFVPFDDEDLQKPLGHVRMADASNHSPRHKQKTLCALKRITFRHFIEEFTHALGVPVM